MNFSYLGTLFSRWLIEQVNRNHQLKISPKSSHNIVLFKLKQNTYSFISLLLTCLSYPRRPHCIAADNS